MQVVSLLAAADFVVGPGERWLQMLELVDVVNFVG